MKWLRGVFKYKKIFVIILSRPGLCKILCSENTIPIALLQYYYWAPFGYLGNTSVVQNRGNSIAIVFLYGNQSGKIKKRN